MKITLFLEDRILEFELPRQISGSYNFDYDDYEEDKLINIEAKNGKWVLYSTDTSLIINNNVNVPSIDVNSNNYYVIEKSGKRYLIFISDILSKNVSVYDSKGEFSIMISNKNNANVVYNCPYLENNEVSIIKSGGYYTLVLKECHNIYIDNIAVKINQINIKYGSVISVLGMKIFILPNLIIFNYSHDSVVFNNLTLATYSYPVEELQNISFKDIDLYNPSNYFSKSPRIRRLIEEKEFSFDGPPKLKEAEKTPLILTLGPMLSLMASSGITLLNTCMNISDGKTTFRQSWTSFATCGVMIITSLIWPSITRLYNNKLSKKSNIEVETKYKAYLEQKETELLNEFNLQKSIWMENLISCKDCIEIINSRNNRFWCKRKDQKDFLTVRVGIGKVPLCMKVNYPKEGFKIEEDNLKQMADDMLNKYKEVTNVPVGYSLFDNYLTAIMGPMDMCYSFLDNMILQLGTFYCYDEIKFVVFTDKEHESKWEYLKYSNYCFDNDKNIRFFASNDEDYKELSTYFMQELQYRLDAANSNKLDPKGCNYYIIICDNYKEAKKLEFFKKLVEAKSNVGYSAVFIENKLSNLPSKCVNFITLNKGNSGILNNSFESATVNEFHEEISDEYDMRSIMNVLSNVPIEVKTKDAQLPKSIGFLEMEKVGKVEQLNILNRWNSNDSVKTLKAEVGVDSEGELLSLDLHEKAHGPHGLIAGMTGSGKSEFIITYILSMCMNYSPDDVSFVLIDYKGGGLAGAFLNETNGIRLPHLAGIITNLDKSELNRTLVSIDSEVKRRQKVFNDARDALKEGTIDIYKYQDFYHQGKIKEPVSHLFIVCDEFAELKSQQPEFMDNLISVARIGRSLGVHLILATQKPSGVVNDQIWSNSKFRVCLKVQDAGDSNEMLKKPDAANIKQTGRFYLQVGYDELYQLGQSAWCGAKYYPSDKVVKTVDKSVNFINNLGMIVKSEEDKSDMQLQAQGEQISSILQEIINVAKQSNKYSRMLWLESIPSIILTDNIIKKYNIVSSPYNFNAIIGEYDAPEVQKQGIVSYNLIDDGNTAIYGTDGSENEMLLNTIIYSLIRSHSAEELNIYLIDYGSESLRIFGGAPQIGGIVTSSDDEKYTNLINMIKEEKVKRKELFVNYGGEYKNYLRNSGSKLPLKVVILNNYDAMKSSIASLYEELPELVRDSDRYGIVYIITASSTGTIGSKVLQSIPNAYCLHMKDVYDYTGALGVKTKINPKDILGRGVCNIGGAHEFQTCFIIDDSNKMSDYVISLVNELRKNSTVKAKKIPCLPTNVLFDDVDDNLRDYTNVPYGIVKSNLEICNANLIDNIGNLVLANKIDIIKNFGISLVEVLRHVNNSNILFVDAYDNYNELNGVVSYYNKDFPKILDSLIEYTEKCMNNTDNLNNVIIFNGLSRFALKVDDKKKLETLFNNLKKIEKIPVIVFDEALKLKQYNLEPWYRTLFNGQEGLWIGSGISDQQLLKVSSFNKEFKANYKSDFGFYVSSGNGTLIKLLNFTGKDSE